MKPDNQKSSGLRQVMRFMLTMTDDYRK